MLSYQQTGLCIAQKAIVNSWQYFHFWSMYYVDYIHTFLLHKHVWVNCVLRHPSNVTQWKFCSPVGEIPWHTQMRETRKQCPKKSEAYDDGNESLFWWANLAVYLEKISLKWACFCVRNRLFCGCSITEISGMFLHTYRMPPYCDLSTKTACHL